MPPGSFHLVGTVDRSDAKSTPAAMQGFFFDSCYGMRRTLSGLVQCAIWHNEWTNVLYNDRLKLLAFLLDWHARAPKFSGEQLYSLLFAAYYHSWLRPIEHTTVEAMQSYHPLSKLHGARQDIGKFLSNTAERIFNRLNNNEKALYSDLEVKFRNYLLSEYKLRIKALQS
jgi:hypothetical protein